MKRAEAGAGSVSQRYGSADPDTDPYQNVTDPEHCKQLYQRNINHAITFAGEGGDATSRRPAQE
jgi:hypothetical protein